MSDRRSALKDLAGALTLMAVAAGGVRWFSTTHGASSVQASATLGADGRGSFGGGAAGGPSRAPAGVPSQAPGDSGKDRQTRPSRASSEFKSEIASLASCYQRDCGFPSSYPREYANVLGQKLKAQLLSFADYAQATGARDPEIAETAREQLDNEDGHVKEGALRLMATQDPSRENRDAILGGVIASHDENLVPQALLELRRYDLTNSPEIHAGLAEALVTGDPFVASAIARDVGPFINASTFESYSAALARLSPGTKPYEGLRAALKQYRLRQMGG